MLAYRRRAAPAFLGLLGLLLAGCLETAAPGPNVEGTVRARVSATMQALARTQPSPTRAPVGPTVIPIGSAPAGGTAIATPAASVSAAAPIAAATQSPRPSTVPVVGSPALGTPAPAGTAAVGLAPTPAATSAALSSPAGTLSFGTMARLGPFSVTVNRYEWGNTCPGTEGAVPAALPQGSKLVGVYATGRNHGTAAADVPAMQWTFEGYPALGGAQSPCLPGGAANPAFVTSCLAGSRLSPDARCAGWVVFQVPEALPVPGAVVRLQSPIAAQWRLPG